MYASDEYLDTAELEDAPETHADHLANGEPDPDCADCDEATAMLWEDLMRPY